MEAPSNVIVGAGASGLAAAAMLKQAGHDVVVLEAGDAPGTSWRERYDRLHLHTPRLLSGLPGHRIPRRYGRWVPRDGVADYLAEYADRQGLEVRTGVRVERIDPGWRLETSAGTIDAERVVVATGYSRRRTMPDWPGRDGFAGELLHSGAYRNAEPFRGRDVLVVGTGNSGAEIAVDLAESGAKRVRVAVRTPPHITRRDSLGIPAQALGIAIGKLPRRAVDPLSRTLRKLSIPDLEPYGLPLPPESLGAQFRRTGTVPILDIGFVDGIRSRRIEIVAAVEGFDGASVLLADGTRIEPEVVIAATGFRPDLEPLVGHLGVLDERGVPRAHAPDEAAPGLWFIGFTPSLGGLLRRVAQDSRKLAAAVSER